LRSSKPLLFPLLKVAFLIPAPFELNSNWSLKPTSGSSVLGSFAPRITLFAGPPVAEKSVKSAASRRCALGLGSFGPAGPPWPAFCCRSMQRFAIPAWALPEGSNSPDCTTSPPQKTTNPMTIKANVIFIIKYLAPRSTGGHLTTVLSSVAQTLAVELIKLLNRLNLFYSGLEIIFQPNKMHLIFSHVHVACTVVSVSRLAD
jgi:hypothetical protein